jgi:hypothetical protein
VFIASVSAMDDKSTARSFGLIANDSVAFEQARKNRARGEQRQEAICAGLSDCQVIRVPTANHLVHNEALPQVMESVRQLTV